MTNFKHIVLESGLSRIFQKTQNFDTGAITAFRSDKPYAVNHANNKRILAVLLRKGYSVTKIKGSYIESYGKPNAREVGEESFFVVDHEHTGELKNDLLALGREFDQDSILFIEHEKPGVLIGTSKREDSFPEFNQEYEVGRPVFGDVSGEFFSRVKGRQFAFESITEIKEPPTNNGKWAMKTVADKLLRTLLNNLFIY